MHLRNHLESSQRELGQSGVRHPRLHWNHKWEILLDARFFGRAVGVWCGVHCRNDGYVKVVGQLRLFNGKVSMSIHHIQPIYSFNEITDHFLSCISCYLYYKKKYSVVALELGDQQGSTAVGSTSTMPAEAPMGMMGGELSETETKVCARARCDG